VVGVIVVLGGGGVVVWGRQTQLKQGELVGVKKSQMRRGVKEGKRGEHSTNLSGEPKIQGERVEQLDLKKEDR